jgi:hypothetical protein
MKDLLRLFFVLAILFTMPVYAQDTGMADTSAKPMAVNEADLKWMPADILGKGAEIAIVAGNPKEAGLFTIRLRFPANYNIMPHYHPGMEHVTILEGVMYAATGKEFTREKSGLVLKKGATVAIPGKVAHYGYTKGPLIIQISGVGPFDNIYFNKADDPRMK